MRDESKHFQGFETWDAVLKYVAAGARVFYHAPFDARPASVSAQVKGKRVRVTPWDGDADPFFADEGHRERFVRDVRHTIPRGAL